MIAPARTVNEHWIEFGQSEVAEETVVETDRDEVTQQDKVTSLDDSEKESPARVARLSGDSA